jgi:chorismate mutase
MPQMRIPVEWQAVVSAPNPSAELAALRRAIDAVDEALAGLLASRVCLSHQAQELKARAGLPVIDRRRELEIQHRYEQRWHGAATVARSILSLCREN